MPLFIFQIYDFNEQIYQKYPIYYSFTLLDTIFICILNKFKLFFKIIMKMAITITTFSLKHVCIQLVSA